MLDSHSQLNRTTHSDSATTSPTDSHFPSWLWTVFPSPPTISSSSYLPLPPPVWHCADCPPVIPPSSASSSARRLGKDLSFSQRSAVSQPLCWTLEDVQIVCQICAVGTRFGGFPQRWSWPGWRILAHLHRIKGFDKNNSFYYYIIQTLF